LVIWYAKHLLNRKQGATKGSGGAANLNESDDKHCQRLRIYNDSASSDDNLNGGGEANAGAGAAPAIMGCGD
jgi:hypothetical protein